MIKLVINVNNLIKWLKINNIIIFGKYNKTDLNFDHYKQDQGTVQINKLAYNGLMLSHLMFQAYLD